MFWLWLVSQHRTNNVLIAACLSTTQVLIAASLSTNPVLITAYLSAQNKSGLDHSLSLSTKQIRFWLQPISQHKTKSGFDGSLALSTKQMIRFWSKLSLSTKQIRFWSQSISQHKTNLVLIAASLRTNLVLIVAYLSQHRAKSGFDHCLSLSTSQIRFWSRLISRSAGSKSVFDRSLSLSTN